MLLYVISINEVEKLQENIGDELFPKRMIRARRFLKREDYLRSFGAGILISKILKVNENDICETEHHKPYIKDSNIHFNISHSGKYCLLAVDEDEIGVDIELIDSSHLRLASEVYLDEEREWMKEDPLKRFFILWTMKESVMKEKGLGFYLSPKSFSVLPAINDGSLELSGEKLYLKTTEYDDCVISVCAKREISIISVKEITFEQICSKIDL